MNRLEFLKRAGAVCLIPFLPLPLVAAPIKPKVQWTTKTLKFYQIDPISTDLQDEAIKAYVMEKPVYFSTGKLIPKNYTGFLGWFSQDCLTDEAYVNEIRAGYMIGDIRETNTKISSYRLLKLC